MPKSQTLIMFFDEINCLSKIFSYQKKGYEGAKDRQQMNKLGIKTIFNCATKNCDCLFKGEFHYIEYALRDNPGADMSQLFIEIADSMHKSSQSGNI